MSHVDCACVIHGDAYSWKYVDTLYSMLTRHSSRPIRLHVYTEAERSVPEPYVKHVLQNWALPRPKQAWWYKMQLFDSAHHTGPMLYLDLDVVIVNNIDWIWQLPTDKFWTIHDFKRLHKPTHQGINSSVMWWDVKRFGNIWQNFVTQNLQEIIGRFPGDQDYLSQTIAPRDLKFFGHQNVVSWRWQCADGGYDFQARRWLAPGTAPKISNKTSIVVFHGQPKPDQLKDSFVLQHWR